MVALAGRCLRVSIVPTVTTDKAEAMKAYVQAHKGRCRDCHVPIFWCRTASGKRIPIDFPNSTLFPNKTHRLIFETKDGSYTGEIEAWPNSTQATHTCHFDTCDRRASR